jgi:SAM-dependent methyltransferase
MEHALPLIRVLFNQLKNARYDRLQYVPTRKNFFGLFKEGENIKNLFWPAKHLMFYYSIRPHFYINRITRNSSRLAFYYQFCFLNTPQDKNSIHTYLGEEWFNDADRVQLVRKTRDGKYALTVSVLPIGEYLILRDDHNSYQYYEYDSNKPENRVYVGADSVKFVEYNQRFLRERRYKNALELGCGTGIQLICAENFCDHLTGIDVNPRAVEFTKASAELNGISSRFTVFQSDLFENIRGSFDLILANPWFLDLQKGGLEEIPLIFEKLDEFLEPNGVFVMYFGSYIKDGVDQGKTVVMDFAKRRGYEAVFRRLGKTIEPHFLKRYRELNISHINSYYVVLTKNGSVNSLTHEPSLIRRLRDEIFIPLQRVLKKAG